MAKITYKNLFTLITEEIQKNKEYQSNRKYQSSRTAIEPYNINSSDGRGSVSLAELVAAIQDLLADSLPARIIEGLNVSAQSPLSDKVEITAGKGCVGGNLYELEEDITLQIPFDNKTDTFYINLYKDRILIDKNQHNEKLSIAKIIVPKPGLTSYIQDKQDTSNNAYIVNLRTYNLYGDINGNFEEDTVDLLRDNIGDILADNLIGNIRLSEDLKIINTSGTLELDSNSMKLKDTDSNLLAKFNKDGTYFYDVNGIEIARFTTSDARIGNILITKNSIGSGDFISEEKGFRIQDNGYAEFEDVRIRGKISSSVFEYDKISAVGGKLIVGNSSTLAQDIDSSDTTIETTDAVFSDGEILRIKDSINEEYMLITDSSNAPIYSVTRDLANAYPTDPTWNKGTAIISTGDGTGDTGFIILDSVSEYSPFIDINVRNSSTYNDWSTKVRLGNLEGITDSDYGILDGFGLYSDNVYLKGKLYAPDIRTAPSGRRVQLDTDGLSLYDTEENRRFFVALTDISGDIDIGDVLLGDMNADEYLWWDDSEGILCIKGSVSADRISSGTICLSGDIIIESNPCESGNLGRTIFDSYGIRSYNEDGILTFGLCNGQACFIDPTCSDCYTYISGSELIFHDECGDVKFIKRAQDGVADTGDTICLFGWKCQPKIIVSVKSLNSYDADYSAQTQRWNVYADNIECFIESGNCYGWRFEVHATLDLAEGQGNECVKEANFGVCVCTDVNVCCTCVRYKFQLWCNDNPPSNYYYGILCYATCYRCLGCGTWCSVCCCYEQPHGNTTELKTTQDQYIPLSFGSSAQWQIMACCVSLTWCDSGLPSGCCCCCCCNCALTNCLATHTVNCNCCYACTFYDYVTWTPPDNVYCSILCICMCECLYANNATGSAENIFHDVNCAGGCCLIWSDYIPYGEGPKGCLCNYSKVCCRGASNYICKIKMTQIRRNCCCSGIWVYTGCWTCTHATCIIYCYYVYEGTACSCCFCQLYSLCDCYGSAEILDPSGVLNWLAMAYS